ncbi:MAG TPA: hypothetical protein ENJ71_01280 [Epsilonproteobacteria bacterium]|nr:hypothetical protein [Campylobacterota bacterium]
MELTPIKIPEIPLPFDIPALMHPPVDHFVIALPVVVLLLEIINLFAKKRAIGVISFFLIILTVVAAVAAYLTGSADGKAAWDLLSEAGQAELKDHKILGTYLMLASAVVLLFKLLSAMINRALMKGLFLFVLIFFVAGILKQGKEGGELVYTHGANVKIVKIKDDKLFDCQDDLSDYVAEEKEAEEAAAKAAEEAKKTETTETTEEAVKAPEAEKAAEVEKAPETEKAESVTEAVEEKAAEATAPAAEEATEAAEASQPDVEVVPAPAEAQPEVATH